MFINPITAAMGAIELLNNITSNHKKDDKAATASMQNNYDVNNMSLNDLKIMTKDLVQQGKLSEKDANSFLAQSSAIQQSSGIAIDSKVNMVDLYQQHIQHLDKDSKNNEVAAYQHSLDILNGVKALSGSKIPQFV